MKDPQITLKCDCGTDGSAAYGEAWTCPNCGRTYDTSHIPSGDYDQILGLTRRYRMIGWAIVSVLAVVALTGQTVSIFAGLAVALLGWFLYIKPVMHRRHRKAVAALTRTWEVEAEDAPSGGAPAEAESLQ